MGYEKKEAPPPGRLVARKEAARISGVSEITMRRLDMASSQHLLVTRKEAAFILGVCVMTMRRHEKKGIIEPVRLSPRGKVNYRLADVLGLVNQRKDS